MMTEFALDLASCTTGRVYTARVTQLIRGTHLYKDWTLDITHLYCPRSLWNGKAMTYFLLDLASCTTVHAAHGSARTVWQPADSDRRVTAVSKTEHNTLLLPLSGVLCLESVMSDKMSVCVCVCVVHTTHFYCPPITLKWKNDDLFFAWSRKLHDYGARGPRPWGAQCVAASWWEGHSRFEDWTHYTFIAPFWCAVPWICHEW